MVPKRLPTSIRNLHSKYQELAKRLAATLPNFTDLSIHQQAASMRGFTEVTLGVGSKLCNEGETAKYAYLLNSGECQIIRNIRKPV